MEFRSLDFKSKRKYFFVVKPSYLWLFFMSTKGKCYTNNNLEVSVTLVFKQELRRNIVTQIWRQAQEWTLGVHFHEQNKLWLILNIRSHPTLLLHDHPSQLVSGHWATPSGLTPETSNFFQRLKWKNTGYHHLIVEFLLCLRWSGVTSSFVFGL